ncbi:uncharacterized protein LOC119112008 [Pollicipes pollicipes]|uniref:uncharacterized protein LOC119112008 n=1 Tax=Pollicipes pollicipes TaxID=41117 RepID=UPI001884A269|nr:uncharacterized protein LOC119112008 [Pollicipes pollicipes]
MFCGGLGRAFSLTLRSESHDHLLANFPGRISEITSTGGVPEENHITKNEDRGMRRRLGHVAELEHLKEPAKITKNKGRPRGSTAINVIGLPKLKLRTMKTFPDLLFHEKQNVMLRWILKNPSKEGLFGEGGVRAWDVIHLGRLKANPDVLLSLGHRFTRSEWKMLLAGVDQFDEERDWLCGCGEDHLVGAPCNVVCA